MDEIGCRACARRPSLREVAGSYSCSASVHCILAAASSPVSLAQTPEYLELQDPRTANPSQWSPPGPTHTSRCWSSAALAVCGPQGSSLPSFRLESWLPGCFSRWPTDDGSGPLLLFSQRERCHCLHCGLRGSDLSDRRTKSSAGPGGPAAPRPPSAPWLPGLAPRFGCGSDVPPGIGHRDGVVGASRRSLGWTRCSG